jgi:hypothetical protein
MKPRYVLVTPARNEEARVDKRVQSVGAQWSHRGCPVGS